MNRLGVSRSRPQSPANRLMQSDSYWFCVILKLRSAREKLGSMRRAAW